MYRAKLDLIRTERAIKEVKDTFERLLAEALNLSRISAPLFVPAGSGLNDNLNGVERPVSFDLRSTGTRAEVVQSLAKWKRYALAKYGFEPHSGLYCDMTRSAATKNSTPCTPSMSISGTGRRSFCARTERASIWKPR